MTKRQGELLTGGFLSVSESAKWLAISRSRLYELIAAGVLSHARISGKICVPRRALHEYVAQRLVIGTIA